MRLEAPRRSGVLPPRTVLNEIACLSVEGRVVVRGDYPEDLPIPGHPDTERRAVWETASAEALDILARRRLAVGKKLGCGTYGCAYTLAEFPNRVLKITGDNVEAASVQTVLAAVAEGRTTWEALPALSRFYCVYALAKKDGDPLGVFALIQDRMKPLSTQEQRFVTTYRYTILSPSTRQNAVNRARSDLGPEAARQVQRLGETLAELDRIGVWWDDLHAGNVMQTDGGEWKIIDLGAGESAPKVDVARVEGLSVAQGSSVAGATTRSPRQVLPAKAATARWLNDVAESADEHEVATWYRKVTPRSAPDPTVLTRDEQLETIRRYVSTEKIEHLGRGVEWIRREGKLGGKGYVRRSTKARRKLLDACVKEYGYRSCLGSIQALERSDVIARLHGDVLSADRAYLVETYGGEGSFRTKGSEERLTIIERDEDRIVGSRVQSILFLKDEYTPATAKRWVQKHANKLGEALRDVDLRTVHVEADGEDSRYWHVRLIDPSEVVRTTFGTKTIKERDGKPIVLIRVAVPKWRAELGPDRLSPRRRT